MQCTNARFLGSDRSDHLRSEPQQLCIIVHSTSNHSGNLAASGWKPQITVASFLLNSVFRIFIRKLQASCFVLSIAQEHVFMSQNEAGFSLRLATFICLYVLFQRLKLLRNRTLKASFFSRKQLASESLVQFVIHNCGLLVNQIIWTILTKIVIG